MSMDLRRRARPGRKTGDIPPDRTETRPKAEPRRPFGRMCTRGHRTFWKCRSRTKTRYITQFGPRPNFGRRGTDQSETAAGRFRSWSAVLQSCEPPICAPTCVPTGVTITSWSLPLSGDRSRTNRPQLRGNVGALTRSLRSQAPRRGVMFRDRQLLRESQSRCSAAGESAPCPPKSLTGRSVPGIHRR